MPTLACASPHFPYNLAVPSPDSPRQLVSSASDSGSRLDRFIADQCPDLSRSRVQQLIESGLVLVNGRAAKGSHRMRAGEQISVEVQPRPAMRAEAESIPLDVLYEDDDVVVINKAAGMTVHAGAGNLRGTLVNALLGRGQGLSQGGDVLRPGIVHRLDKETSGAILVAKNDAAHAKLGEAFRKRAVKKMYLALVQGILKEDTGRIALAIARDPVHRVRMTARRSVVLANAREALTEWRVLARFGSAATLVEIQLHTGRTHQIRAHFSAIGHPVIGDTLYGSAARLQAGKTELAALGRNFLHAARLGFAQPSTGARIEIVAPLPDALRDYLHQLEAATGTPGAAAERIDAALAGYL